MDPAQPARVCAWLADPDRAESDPKPKKLKWRLGSRQAPHTLHALDAHPAESHTCLALTLSETLLTSPGMSHGQRLLVWHSAPMAHAMKSGKNAEVTEKVNWAI